MKLVGNVAKDPFPSFSFSPPSTPPSCEKQTPFEISHDCLLPESESIHLFDPQSQALFSLEPVLFPRQNLLQDRRSISFDPRLYINLSPLCYPPVQNKSPSDIISAELERAHQSATLLYELESILERTNGEGDYTNEPFDITDPTSINPKRVKINGEPD